MKRLLGAIHNILAVYHIRDSYAGWHGGRTVNECIVSQYCAICRVCIRDPSIKTLRAQDKASFHLLFPFHLPCYATTDIHVAYLRHTTCIGNTSCARSAAGTVIYKC